ncbi:hemolysin [Pseudoalteromonas sp. MMG010]|uniref:hemolysin n=1 Tax=Pseudoalteromonas sp. MMG010 TaxID=2822685 RepID=UPI001B39E8F4|nr:hemolysin [Pseudoalteromonas sp. MMG010]MBQ4831947.1 hemolysin [Pseudoalteromonas sp. MMG010]
MKKATLYLSILSATLFCNSQQVAAQQCHGQLYGINAGRGETGLILKIDEFSQYVVADSKAEFSSAALAYDEKTNRLYYVSAPRAYKYQVETDHLDLNTTEQASLPLAASNLYYTRLAYVDLATNEHTVVGYTKLVHRLVFDNENQRLIGSAYNKIYSIDPSTGESEDVGEISGLGNIGLWRGDLVFKDSQLLFVSSTSIYNINLANLSATKLSDHGLTPVTGAALDKQGNLLLSRTKLSDYGNSNSSTLYKVNEYSGKSCLVAELPARIDDLAYTRESTGCYEVPLCSVEDTPTITLSAIQGSVEEGGTLSYQVNLSTVSSLPSTILLAVDNGTADESDYDFEAQQVTIEAGDNNAVISIPTIDNTEYEEDKTLTLHAKGIENATGEDSQLGSILENDEDNATKLTKAAEGGVVNWNGSIGCEGQNPYDCQSIAGIKGFFPGAPQGTTIRFYIANRLIAQKTLPNDGFTYAGDSESRWDMNRDEIAWATLTYDGVTVTGFKGHKAVLHNNHYVCYANNTWTAC